MKVIKGDLLNPPSDVDAVCIPTNLQVRKDGTAVMGAGLALAASKKWTDLDKYLGVLLQRGYEKTIIVQCVHSLNIVAVPTKDHWRQSSSLILISQSLGELVGLANQWSWKQVWVPSLGTGLGKLSTSLVWPIMHEKLDDRFTMVLKG